MEANSSSQSDATANEIPQILEKLTDLICDKQSNLFIKRLNGSNFQLQCLSSKGTKRLISDLAMNADSIAGLDSNSDLLPGIYEGGFKLWECTHDLLEYLSDNIVFNNGDKVFEIGCGSGLLGIQCLLRGAHCVHFQDFNLDVLKWFTIPNIAINCSGVSDKQALFQTRCNFFFGDWRNVKQQLAELNLKYDYIFSSETIYNTQNYSAFVELVKSCLASNGVAFIAAKSYYFGVGGGMHDFEQFIQNDDRLQSSVCATIDASVPRQIIKLHFKA